MVHNAIAPEIVEKRRASSPLVTVVIVTWNCSGLIEECLNWLSRSQVDCEIETIVVDNASKDETFSIVRERPDVDVAINSNENLGFGRGNNLGVEYARGDFVLLLNPDAFLQDPASLAKLLAVIEEDPKVGSVGPMLVNLDGSHQVGDAGHEPNLRNVAAHQLFISKLLPGAPSYYVSRGTGRSKPRAVGWISGACQLVRKSSFAAVGGFPKEIFMYGEDVELGARMSRRGDRLLYLPEVRVLHLQGATQKVAGSVYISTKWIDSIFASDSANVRDNSLRRWVLRVVLAGGFLIRAAVYTAKALLTAGGAARAQANAMLHYARHSISVAGR